MDLETDIQDEIAACENTQNWTGGKAIRTRWVDELKGLDETLEALTRATQLKDEALYSETLDYDECCKAVEEATESFRAANKAAIDKQYDQHLQCLEQRLFTHPLHHLPLLLD